MFLPKKKTGEYCQRDSISSLHELVCSRLDRAGFKRNLSHIKRCGDLILMDPDFRERFVSDSEMTLKEASLDVNPMDARVLFIGDVDSECHSRLSETGYLYSIYCRDSAAYVAPTRSWHTRNRVLDSWRQMQIARCDNELGKAGRKLAHLPLAFELSTGCSVGCWFCGLNANKLSGVFHYTDRNALLWKQCLSCMHMLLGEDVEAPICYYATEPLDNPDLPLFIKDCFCEFHGIPQLTTAVPTRNLRYTKFVLQELAKLQLTLHRFSITSIEEFRKVMEMFSPEELLNVVLMPRFRECPKAKFVKAGKAYENDDRTSLTGTIACVSGFVVNMDSKSVRLVTPTRPCAAFPNGEIVIGMREFNDVDDLKNQVMKLLKIIESCDTYGAANTPLLSVSNHS